MALPVSLSPSRVVALSAVAIGSCALGGCIISTDIGGGSKYTRARTEVSDYKLDEIVASNTRVRLGQPKHDVLATYPAETLTFKSSIKQDGSIIEEWRTEAVSRSNDVYFRRYLYFVDDRLVEMSDDRIDYREDPRYLDRWLTD